MNEKVKGCDNITFSMSPFIANVRDSFVSKLESMTNESLPSFSQNSKEKEWKNKISQKEKLKESLQ